MNASEEKNGKEPAGSKGLLWPLRRIYDWVLSWSHSRYGAAALFVLAFAEASFFPIPPDVLLIAMALGAPKKSFRLAGICTAGSVLGAAFGYGIGFLAAPFARDLVFELAGAKFYYEVAAAYGDNAFIAIALAGFTPIPFKVFTLSAGVFHATVGFGTLMGASLFSRGIRFFLVSGLIFAFGPPVRRFIDRYFDWMALAFGALMVLGFVVIGAGSKSEISKESMVPVLLAELEHPDQGIRTQAWSQLKAFTESGAPLPDCGYDPSRDAVENRRAVEMLRRWWEERNKTMNPLPD